MSDKPQYYLALFTAVSDALEALRQRNYGTAERILLQGQITAESIVMESRSENA